MWRDKCKYINRKGNKWVAILHNDQAVSADSLLKLQIKVNDIKCDADPDGEGHWITMNGAHIILNGENEIDENYSSKGYGGATSELATKLHGFKYLGNTSNEETKSHGEDRIWNTRTLQNHPKKSTAWGRRMGSKAKATLGRFAQTLNMATYPMHMADTINKMNPKANMTSAQAGRIAATLNRAIGNFKMDKNGKKISGSFSIMSSIKKAAASTITHANSRNSETFHKYRAMARDIEDYIRVAPKHTGTIFKGSIMSKDALDKMISRQKQGLGNNMKMGGPDICTSSNHGATKEMNAKYDALARKGKADGMVKVRYEFESKQAASLRPVLEAGSTRGTSMSNTNMVMVSGGANFAVKDIVENADGSYTIKMQERNWDAGKDYSEAEARFGDPAQGVVGTRKLNPRKKK